MIRAAVTLWLLLASTLAAAPTEDQALSTTVTFAIAGDVVELKSHAAPRECVFLSFPMAPEAIYLFGAMSGALLVGLLWALLRLWCWWVAQ